MGASSSKKDIISFAQKYIDFFENKFGSEKSKFDFFGEVEFAEDCDALGFEMDCGESFRAVDDEASRDFELFKSRIDKYTDIKVIGSGLYSNWRYYNHWDSPSHANNATKEWFLILLRRLIFLCNQD